MPGSHGGKRRSLFPSLPPDLVIFDLLSGFTFHFRVILREASRPHFPYQRLIVQPRVIAPVLQNIEQLLRPVTRWEILHGRCKFCERKAVNASSLDANMEQRANCGVVIALATSPRRRSI
jgi:hypothetical protein